MSSQPDSAFHSEAQPDSEVTRRAYQANQQQLAAANQRIAELTEQRNIMSGHFSHLEMCRDNATVRAEAAERKLAVARTAFINIRSFIRDYQGLTWDGVRSFCQAALAAIDQPQGMEEDNVRSKVRTPSNAIP